MSTELHIVAIKDVHQPAELGQAAAQAVDLVDGHDGNEARWEPEN